MRSTPTPQAQDQRCARTRTAEADLRHSSGAISMRTRARGRRVASSTATSMKSHPETRCPAQSKRLNCLISTWNSSPSRSRRQRRGGSFCSRRHWPADLGLLQQVCDGRASEVQAIGELGRHADTRATSARRAYADSAKMRPLRPTRRSHGSNAPFVRPNRHPATARTLDRRTRRDQHDQPPLGATINHERPTVDRRPSLLMRVAHHWIRKLEFWRSQRPGYARRRQTL